MDNESAWPDLDSALPSWSFASAHHIAVRASAEAAWRALLEVRPSEVHLLGPLMFLRRLGTPRPRGLAGLSLLDAMCAQGFRRLGGTAGHDVVVGTIGRFWSWRPDMATPADAAGFSSFSPGWAKGVMGFRVVALGGDACRLETRTRVAATSPDAHRAFARYWRVVRIGSALIRRSWLQAIRRRAEGPSSSR